MSDMTKIPLVGTWVDHETWECPTGFSHAAMVDYCYCGERENPGADTFLRPPESSRPIDGRLVTPTLADPRCEYCGAESYIPCRVCGKMPSHLESVTEQDAVASLRSALSTAEARVEELTAQAHRLTLPVSSWKGDGVTFCIECGAHLRAGVHAFHCPHNLPAQGLMRELAASYTERDTLRAELQRVQAETKAPSWENVAEHVRGIMADREAGAFTIRQANAELEELRRLRAEALSVRAKAIQECAEWLRSKGATTLAFHFEEQFTLLTPAEGPAQ